MKNPNFFEKLLYGRAIKKAEENFKKQIEFAIEVKSMDNINKMILWPLSEAQNKMLFDAIANNVFDDLLVNENLIQELAVYKGDAKLRKKIAKALKSKILFFFDKKANQFKKYDDVSNFCRVLAEVFELPDEFNGLKNKIVEKVVTKKVKVLDGAGFRLLLPKNGEDYLCREAENKTIDAILLVEYVSNLENRYVGIGDVLYKRKIIGNEMAMCCSLLNNDIVNFYTKETISFIKNILLLGYENKEFAERLIVLQNHENRDLRGLYMIYKHQF